MGGFSTFPSPILNKDIKIQIWMEKIFEQDEWDEENQNFIAAIFEISSQNLRQTFVSRVDKSSLEIYA